MLPKCFQAPEELKGWKDKCPICLSGRCECHQHYEPSEIAAARTAYDGMCAEYNGARLLEPGDWGTPVQTEEGVQPFTKVMEDLAAADGEYVVYITPKKVADAYIIPTFEQYNGPKMLRYPLKT